MCIRESKYFPMLVVLILILGTGCFSIPFIGGGGPPADFEPQEEEFDRSNVFVGYDDDGRPIVEIRLIDQEVTIENGLVINVRIFTTEHFEVVNIFRGLRSINYYPVERRFHRLELNYGRRKVKMKVSENLQIKGDKPVDAAFEHTGTYHLLPDTINALKLKFQDVDRWAKLPADTLDTWYVDKSQYFQRAERVRQRNTLVEAYRQRQEDDYTQTFVQYDSLFVTTNNAYVFLEKETASKILYTLNAGDQVDYGVSDGVWVEVPVPDSLQDELMYLFLQRQQDAIQQREVQRRAARARRGGGVLPQAEIDTTLKLTGYMLDVMAQKRQENAIAWEKDNMLEPVDVPLFAQVLLDRETERVARIDSIEKAYQDSLKAIEDSIAAIAAADSIARADSLAAIDSVATVQETAATTVAPADTAVAAAASAATPADTVSADTSATPAAAPTTQPQKDQQDQEQVGGPVRTLTGPNGQKWTGRGPPPWAGQRAQEEDKEEQGVGRPQAPQQPGSDGGQAPDSTAAPPDSSKG